MLLVLDSSVEAFAKTLGHLVFDSITHEFHDVLGPVQDRGTVGANLEMRFHTGAHLRVNISVQVIRDLSPDLEAAYLNHLHRIQMVLFSFICRRAGPYQGLTFSYSCLPEYQLPSIPGARASRIWRRARRSLVLTLPSVMPSA